MPSRPLVSDSRLCGSSRCASPFLFRPGRHRGRGLKSAELGGGASDGEPATPVASRQHAAIMPLLFQYLGRCETAHFLACSIGGRSAVAWRSCRTVGKASIRSRQACTTGKLAAILLPSGVRPSEWVLGSS